MINLLLALSVNGDLENRFTYHAPKPGQPEIYAKIRDQAKELAYEYKNKN